jgi:hypothetical protein
LAFSNFVKWKRIERGTNIELFSLSFFQVGVEVMAKIEVQSVVEDAVTAAAAAPSLLTEYNKKDGYQIDFKTSVVRVRDEAIIAVGNTIVWIPDYFSHSDC